MDLIKTMIANRHAAGAALPPDPKPRPRGRKPTKTDRAKEQTPGSRAMRKFICEEKPSKKIVKDHLEAMIVALSESSDEE